MAVLLYLYSLVAGCCQCWLLLFRLGGLVVLIASNFVVASMVFVCVVVVCGFDV